MYFMRRPMRGCLFNHGKPIHDGLQQNKGRKE